MLSPNYFPAVDLVKPSNEHEDALDKAEYAHRPYSWFSHVWNVWFSFNGKNNVMIK